MKITHGLMDGQVLQRDKRGVGHARITGSAQAAGVVEICTRDRWEKAGKAKDGMFHADLTGLKTGGPYRVELRIGQESLSIGDVFVGDVWILAGQSNMQGIGDLCDAPDPHPLVRCFSMADEWQLAKEPLHFMAEAVDRVHNGYGMGPDRPSKATLKLAKKALVKGVSPGVAFGVEMVRRTGVPQGLLACAHGGTSMMQWSPSLLEKGGDALYGAMLRRYRMLGQSVAGVLWYQGESDANPDAAPHYTDRMEALVAAVRSDTGLAQLPWIVVQIGRHAATDGVSAWNNIQEQQRLLPARIRHLDVVPVVDLQLDDGIHVGGLGQQVLGKRMARLADRLVNKNVQALPGIVLDKIEALKKPQGVLRLTYRNVAGELVSQGLPSGYALLNKHGHDAVAIYKTTLQGNQVFLHTGMMLLQLEKFSVSYGHGKMPCCNITDSEGMSLPVMNAVPVPADPTRAPELTDWQTALLDGAGSIADVSYKRAASASGWIPAPLRNIFGVLPKPADLQQVGVYAMRTAVTCTEALTAWLILGANAPFRMWINGKLVCQDELAAPPIVPERYKVKLDLKAGRNAVMVAFAPGAPGAHLGIYARIGTARGKVDRRIERCAE